MADPIIPPSNQPAGSQPLSEQQIRIMRGDLGAPAARPIAPIPMQGGSTPTGEPRLNIPPAGGGQIPSKPLFDADEPMFTANTISSPLQGKATPIAPPLKTPAMMAAPATPVAPSVDALIANQRGKKKTGALIGAGAGIIVLGAIGYFVYPLIMKTSTPKVTPPVVTPPVIPVQPVPPVVPPKPSFPSLFIAEPVKRSTAVLPTATPLTASAINNILKNEATPAGSTEVSMTTGENTPVSFVDIIGALAPTLKTQTAEIFTGTMSAYVYSDEAGNWPGYIAKVNVGSTPEAIKAWFSALEKTTSKKNFFIVDPGTFLAFKNGTVNDTYPDRYAAGSTNGASFGYLILPDEQLVLISTSYAGMRDGLRLLGH